MQSRLSHEAALQIMRKLLSRASPSMQSGGLTTWTAKSEHVHDDCVRLRRRIDAGIASSRARSRCRNGTCGRDVGIASARAHTGPPSKGSPRGRHPVVSLHDLALPLSTRTGDGLRCHPKKRSVSRPQRPSSPPCPASRPCQPDGAKSALSTAVSACDRRRGLGRHRNDSPACPPSHD